MSTQKSFIERSVQFEEEPMVATEIGESSSPTPPLVVSEGTNEIYDSDMYDNDDLIADTNSPTRPKWEAKTIQVVRGKCALSNTTLNCQPRKVTCEMQKLYMQD